MKKSAVVIISLVPIIIIASFLIVQKVRDPLSLPPISGSTIGANWHLDETQKMDDGTLWTYTNDDSSLNIRIQKLDATNDAIQLYMAAVFSDNIKLKKVLPLGKYDNMLIGVYHDESGKESWLILVAQNGQTYLGLAYKGNHFKPSYDGNFDEDSKWLKELAEAIPIVDA